MKQSTDIDFGFGTQIRKSPYFDATIRWGAKDFSVYNHMYIPRDFGDPVQNFWNLVTKAILCDVAVERQVEITGPDAAKFTQLLTPRDLSQCAVGQCKYVLITNSDGGILNDPVLLRLAENHFWLSLADNDVLLWAQGVAVNSGMDVNITEPDVSPLQGITGYRNWNWMVFLWLCLALDGLANLATSCIYVMVREVMSYGKKSWLRASSMVWNQGIPLQFVELKVACCPTTPIWISTRIPLN